MVLAETLYAIKTSVGKQAAAEQQGCPVKVIGGSESNCSKQISSLSMRRITGDWKVQVPSFS